MLQEEINPSKISSQHPHQSTLTVPHPNQKTHGFLTLISMVVQVIEVPGVVAFFSSQKNYSGFPHFRKGTQPGMRYLEGGGKAEGCQDNLRKKIGEVHRDICISYLYQTCKTMLKCEKNAIKKLHSGKKRRSEFLTLMGLGRGISGFNYK